MNRHLRIMLVTPYSWQHPHPVNDFLTDMADEMSDMGIPVMLIAPDLRAGKLKTGRKIRKQLLKGGDPETILADRALYTDGNRKWPLVPVGVPLGRVSVVSRLTLRTLAEGFAPTHVICLDPLTPGITAAAVRLSDAIVVGLFTSTDPAQLMSGQTRTGRLLDHIDVSMALTEEIKQLIGIIVGVDTQVILGLTSLAAQETPPANKRENPVTIIRGEHDDLAIEDLIEMLAGSGETGPISIVSRYFKHHKPVIPAAIRKQVSLRNGLSRARYMDAISAADPLYIVPMLDPFSLASGIQHAQSHAMVSASQQVPEVQTPTAAADKLISTCMARAPQTDSKAAAGVSAEKTQLVDLHMHTNHSWDCATEPQALLDAAAEVGLTTIAITDHNEISGALEVQRLAADHPVNVIIGEEIMTTDGEIIGLFLENHIEPGLSWTDTIQEIRRQQGIVYIPHPFDRMHKIPPAALLRETVHEIDILETCNGRLAREAFNREAQQFANRYHLLNGAGSDAHVTQSLGTAALHMPDWSTPEEFLAAVAQAEIVSNPKSYAWVTALKFIQTKTHPTGLGVHGPRK